MSNRAPHFRSEPLHLGQQLLLVVRSFCPFGQRSLHDDVAVAAKYSNSFGSFSSGRCALPSGRWASSDLQHNFLRSGPLYVQQSLGSGGYCACCSGPLDDMNAPNFQLRLFPLFQAQICTILTKHVKIPKSIKYAKYGHELRFRH